MYQKVDQDDYKKKNRCMPPSEDDAINIKRKIDREKRRRQKRRKIKEIYSNGRVECEKYRLGSPIFDILIDIEVIGNKRPAPPGYEWGINLWKYDHLVYKLAKDEELMKDFIDNFKGETPLSSSDWNRTPDDVAEKRLLFWIDSFKNGIDQTTAIQQFNERFGLSLNSYSVAKRWRDKALKVLDLYIIDNASDLQKQNLYRLNNIIQAANETKDYNLMLKTIDLINKTAGIYQMNEQKRTEISIQTAENNFKFSFGGLDMNHCIEDAQIAEYTDGSETESETER